MPLVARDNMHSSGRDPGVGRPDRCGRDCGSCPWWHDGRVDQRWVELARTLRRLGLWRHLPDAEADTAQREMVKKEWPFVGFGDEPDGHWFFSDGEKMAEGFVRGELEGLAPWLRELGVDLHVEDVARPNSVEDGPYIVSINGRRCVVCSPLDWEEHRAWKTAAVRPLGVINELLAEAGATERLFTLYAGGNDGIIWLLDPRIVEAIAASGLKPEDEVPALATADALRE
jgi:hypothetical protein